MALLTFVRFSTLPSLDSDSQNLDVSCAWHGEDLRPQIEWSVEWCAEDDPDILYPETANDRSSQEPRGGLSRTGETRYFIGFGVSPNLWK